MRFTSTPLTGAYLVDLEPVADDRGFFARAFCAEEFEAQGLAPTTAQANLSFNHKRGTLRGLHYQIEPGLEAKFMRCVHGAIYDVIIDLRRDSPSYLQHFGVELSATNRQALYVPPLFAHGYQALTDDAEVIYLVSEFYTPGLERGIRYDDPAFGIEWPAPVTVISTKDATWPDFKEDA